MIIYGTNSHVDTSQSRIYLNDFNNIITKQNIIDLILDSVYDNRDGNILKHTNNINVEIYKDNILVDNITETGYYDITMSCIDSDSNVGTLFYNNDESLTDTIRIYISENNPPIIALNDIRVFNLNSSIITRDDLLNTLINVVIDDRDGIIVPTILDIRLFQIGISVVSGTENSYSSQYGDQLYFIHSNTELLYINDIGQYKMILTITDSDNYSTVAEFIFEVNY